jgi:hypothetical protein
MKSKALMINIVVLVLFANANTIAAQNTTGTAQEWEAVKALVPGEKLSVRLKDGKKKVEGTVRGVSDTQLLLTRGRFESRSYIESLPYSQSINRPVDREIDCNGSRHRFRYRRGGRHCGRCL